MLRKPVSLNLSSVPSPVLALGILEALALALALALLLLPATAAVTVFDRRPCVGDMGTSRVDSDMREVRDSKSVDTVSRDESILFFPAAR